MKSHAPSLACSTALLAILAQMVLQPSAAAGQQNPPEGDLLPAPQIQLNLEYDDGLPLQGSQEVVLRFYAEADSPEALLEVRKIADADDALLRMTLDARSAVDGPAPGFLLSPAELFTFYPAPWMSIEVDGSWTSERLQVNLEEGKVLLASSTEGFHQVETTLHFDTDRLAAPQRQRLLSLRRSVDSDPATHRETNRLCTWRMTCGSTRGQMKWSPVGPRCFQNAVANMPLAIILRGNGFSYRDYDYLQNHLARNRILSASVDVVASGLSVTDHQTAANIAEQFLTSGCFASGFLDRFPHETPVDFHRTGIVGHSRGGETVRYLAFNLLGNPEFTVRAAAALAPTQSTSALINGLRADAYMLLYGTADPDVVASSAFTAHDNLDFNEISTPTALDLDRSMKLLTGANHAGFSDLEQPFSLNDAQRLATRGYLHAFLRAWLRDDFRFYNDYVRADQVPGTWSSAVYSQFSSAIARRVIDNFERNGLSPSTLAGSVLAVGMNLTAPVDATTLSGTSHIGSVLRAQPGIAGAQLVWEIPPGRRNVSSFLYLSLRLGRLSGSGPAEVRLSLQNGTELFSVDLADYGGVPERETMCLESAAGFCQNSALQGHMRTIRIPLEDLGGPHDDVQAVYLEFLSGAVNDDFLIDNLEFADSLFGLP